MKSALRSVALVALALALAQATAVADILVNQGPPDHAGWFFSDPGQAANLADNFSLASPATVVGINFWGVYSASTPTTDDFNLSFLGDSFGGVGLLLDDSFIQVTRTDTGHTISTVTDFT
jgi:hypothetical protein